MLREEFYLLQSKTRAANKKFKKHVKAKGPPINLFKTIMQVCLSRQLQEYYIFIAR